MKNFHLPLPDETYSQLRAEAERSQLPATTLARAAIAEYAAEAAGTELDLDPALESAGIEHLLQTGRNSK